MRRQILIDQIFMLKVQNKTIKTNLKKKSGVKAVGRVSTNESPKILQKTISREQLEPGKKMLAMLMEGKKAAKSELTGQIKKADSDKNNDKVLAVDLKTPLVLIFATDLNGEKELIPREMLFNLLEGCMAVNMRALVIDTQQPSDLNNLGELTAKHEGHIIWYNPLTDNSGEGREEKEIDRLLMAADMAILFRNHLELIQLLLNYGVVIVAEDGSPFLENYKPNEETGNAFLYTKRDTWGVFAAMVRALETYKFTYDWNHIVRKIYK